MRRSTMLASAIAIATTLAACNGTEPDTEPGEIEAAADDEPAEVEPDQPEETEEPAEQEPEPAEPDDIEEPDDEADQQDVADATRGYFDAFATYQPAGMQTMLDHATEGSAAYTYAAVQIANVAALGDPGFSSDPGTATYLDDGDVEMCNVGDDGSRSCSVMGDITLDGGLLSAFTVDGAPIDDRLATGGETTSEGNVAVTLLGAYHSVQADLLVVALDIHNGADDATNLNIYTAEYINDAGRQVTASDAVGPIELRSGAASYATIYFPAQGVGGTFYLEGYSEDFSRDYEWELTLTPLN